MNNLFKKISNNMKFIYIASFVTVTIFELCYIIYLANNGNSGKYVFSSIVGWIVYLLLFAFGFYAEFKEDKKLCKMFYIVFAGYTFYKVFTSFQSIFLGPSSDSGSAMFGYLVGMFYIFCFLAYFGMQAYSYYRQNTKLNDIAAIVGVAVIAFDLIGIIADFISIANANYVWVSFKNLFELIINLLAIFGAYKLVTEKASASETTA